MNPFRKMKKSFPNEKSSDHSSERVDSMVYFQGEKLEMELSGKL
jgi:hypothetical protein